MKSPLSCLASTAETAQPNFATLGISTRFFTNAGANTLLAKLEGVFRHNADIAWFDALAGNLRTSRLFTLRPHMPIIVPTPAQRKRFSELAERAIEAKRCEFANQAPSQALASFCRTVKDTLVAGAPAYLRPDAQEQLLATPGSCLAVIERTVNWEAEKLYGVEGLGPFDEF